jgi:protein-disulfide isomerase
VYLSAYGSVWGVPVALGGLFWFGLVALVAGFAGEPGGRSAAASYVFALATIGLAAILYLGYTSFFVLGSACLLCLGTYVSVIGIFITSGVGSSLSLGQLPSRLFSDLASSLKRTEVAVFALLLLGGTAFAVAKFPAEGTVPSSASQPPPTEQASTDFKTAWFQQPRVDLGIPADGAKVVIVKFNDYQCPGCGATYEWYKPILEKFEKTNPGEVKYIVKDWPWDQECNFNSGPMHESACEAAAAVRMAADRGKAKEQEMAEWVYANQPTLTPDGVKAAAARIAGVTDWAHEYAQKLPAIQRDIADGAALRISSTPTLFINGVRVDKQLMPAPYFEMAIQLELDKAAGK